MVSVVARVRQVQQPRGGFINPRSMEVTQLDDGKPSPLDHKIESVHSSLVGMAVDYMTRFLIGASPAEAFRISLIGASVIREEDEAFDLIQGITGLNHSSLVNACKLAGYDVIYRAGMAGYRPVETINPDMATTTNIAVLVERSLSFFKLYGPITLDGFAFPGGYTAAVNAGDGDFLTEDTLWDFKVSVSGPTKDHTLQLLMYYLMGKASGQPEFDTITHLGIFNPRLNSVYRIALADIAPDIIEEVSSEVIGYK